MIPMQISKVKFVSGKQFEQDRKKAHKIEPIKESAIEEMNLEQILDAYLKTQKKLWTIDQECHEIAEGSPFGQARPIFHKLVDVELKIVEQELFPLWERLKHFIIPGTYMRSFWQEFPNLPGTLPPTFEYISSTIEKYVPDDTMLGVNLFA